MTKADDATVLENAILWDSVRDPGTAIYWRNTCAVPNVWC